eukprot:scaffold317516_cov23-Tisochrysis_lutea.AAC.1
MAFPPDSSSLAAGTYAGYVGTFDPRSPPHAQLQLLLHGHRGGLTQVGGDTGRGLSSIRQRAV